MAFFKFRFPGRNASTEAVASGPNENIEVVRRRARYRLMGAGAGAAVGAGLSHDF